MRKKKVPTLSPKLFLYLRNGRKKERTVKEDRKKKFLG